MTAEADPRLVAVIEQAVVEADRLELDLRATAEMIAADVWAWFAEGDPA